MANVSSSNGQEVNIPKLRFPGFEGEWENKQFGDIFSILPNNTLSRVELTTNGRVLNIHYGDILIKYSSILDVKHDEIPFIIFEKESKDYPYLQDGDIVITDTAEDETVGKSTEIINSNGQKIESGLHTIPCRPKYVYAPKYLGYYINSAHFHKQLIPLMQGVKVLSISKSNISKTVIYAPKSICEQQKIASILYLLDCRIKKQQQVIEALKKYKRGALSKLFPQKGKTKPNYRFFGFTDPWEQCKLKEIVEVYSGRDYKHLDKGDVPVYGTGGYMLSVSEALSEKNDAIGIGRKGTIDNPYILRAPFWTVDTLFYCIPKKDFHLNFVFNIYQNINWKAMDESTGVPSLSKTTINNVEVLTPSKDEQIKISEYFLGLDNLITLHQCNLTEFNKIKTFFLQKLFI